MTTGTCVRPASFAARRRRSPAINSYSTKALSGALNFDARYGQRLKHAILSNGFSKRGESRFIKGASRLKWIWPDAQNLNPKYGVAVVTAVRHAKNYIMRLLGIHRSDTLCVNHVLVFEEHAGMAAPHQKSQLLHFVVLLE